MKLQNPQLHASQRGVALLYAIFGAFVAAAMVSVMLTVSSLSNGQSQMKVGVLRAQYQAEGAVEAAKKELQEAVANHRDIPESGHIDIDGMAVTYSIAQLEEPQQISDGAGILTHVTPYEIITDAEVSGYKARTHRIVRVTATPIFQYAVFYDGDLEIQPADDMTLSGRVHTNGDMFLGAHEDLVLDTNYVRAAGAIKRHLSYGGDANGDVSIRKWVDNPFAGSEPAEFVSMLSEEQFYEQFGVESDSGYDSSFSQGYDINGDGDFDDEGEWLPFAPGSLELWGEPDDYDGSGNTVQTGDHGIQQSVAPEMQSIQMFEWDGGNGDYAWDEVSGTYVGVAPGTGDYNQGYYHANADLSIIVAADSLSWQAYDNDGNDMSADLAGVVTLEEVFDSRQGGMVTVASVDIALLNLSGVFPENGLLYTGHYGTEVFQEEYVDANGDIAYADVPGSIGTGTGASGVLVTNGELVNGEWWDLAFFQEMFADQIDEDIWPLIEDLLGEIFAEPIPVSMDSTGLTVATGGSAYLEGDYNIYNRKGCAIIGDAVNLLSNAWDGTKAPGELPAASETTFNTAILTGSLDTVGSDYGGGFENLPRFHEGWDGVHCRINGSFVNSWESRHATGAWASGGDRYTSPLRDWAYDTLFNDANALPPFTPMVVRAEDIVSW